MTTIIIAEPDRDFRKLLSSFLSSIDTTIYTARSGPELQALLSSHKADLLISEFDLGPLQLHNVLTAPNEGMTLPRLIMLSGNPHNSGAMDELNSELPWYDFIAKPFDLNTLIERVELALGVSPSKSEISQTTPITKDQEHHKDTNRESSRSRLDTLENSIYNDIVER